MRISDRRQNMSAIFDELVIGATFEYNNEIFIRVHSVMFPEEEYGTKVYNALSLEHNEFKIFKPNDCVLQVNPTLIIE